jgi:BlaI family transcriptional regulator, penicillinase repressor
VPENLPGGDLEYAVLAALFEMGRASARQIHARVGAPSGLAYTTIATVLDRLHAKRLADRELKGKAFIYRPGVRRRALELARARQAVERLLGPEPRPAMAALVDAVESTDPDLLDELAKLVAARRRGRHGP